MIKVLLYHVRDMQFAGGRGCGKGYCEAAEGASWKHTESQGAGGSVFCVFLPS